MDDTHKLAAPRGRLPDIRRTAGKPGGSEESGERSTRGPDLAMIGVSVKRAGDSAGLTSALFGVERKGLGAVRREGSRGRK